MGTPTSSNTHSDVRIILDSIRRILRALRLFDRQAERRTGLSAAQLFVLQKLHEGLTDHATVSVNDLAERTFTDQSSVSAIVQKLANRKLISRSRGADDGRRVELALTAVGRRLLRKAPAAAQHRLVAAIDELGRTRRRQLAKLLTVVVEKTGMDHDEAVLFFEEPARRRATAITKGTRRERPSASR